MLVLSRTQGQSLMIADDIEIVVVRTGANQVRLGVRAPKDVPVYRREIYLEKQRERANHEANKAKEIQERL